MKYNCLAHQNKLLKWLLSLSLCFFLFSGNVSNLQPGQHRAVQTELIVKQAQTNKKSTGYFNKFYSSNASQPNYYIAFWKNNLVNHQRALQTKLKVLQQTFVSKLTTHFSPLKTVPQNFKEELASLFLG